MCAIHPSTMTLQDEAQRKCKHDFPRPVYGIEEEQQRVEDEAREKEAWAAGGCWIPYRQHAQSRPENGQGQCILCLQEKK